MHNGVFNDLETVVKFYNKYNSKNPRHKINPETGAAWAPPEVAETISKKELESGSALNSKRVKALVAFLRLPARASMFLPRGGSDRPFDRRQV